MRRQHFLNDTPEYSVWKDARKRCNNPNSDSYPSYGGRGIKMCSEWDDFEVFYKDMGPKPTPQHSLDRKDNNEGYSKNNCRWATKAEQMANRSDNLHLTFLGETKPLISWCQQLSLNYDRTHKRVRKLGWSVERAFTTPVI